MPVFTYEARDRQGRVANGTIEAESTSVAALRLREAGLFITAVRQRQEAGGGSGFNLNMNIKIGGRVKVRDIAILTRQWAVMIRAGLNLLVTLRTLALQSSNDKLKETLGQVRTDVEAGQPLATAMAKHGKVFSPMFTHMIEAGEASGQLDSVLERLAEHAEKDYALRRKVTGAMIYPAVIITAVIGITGFLITSIVPTFAKVFTDFGKPLPSITAFIVGISDFVKGYWWSFPIIIGAVVFGVSRWRKTPAGKLAIDRFLYKLPVFGPIVQKVAVSRFTRTFGTLVESGVNIVPALEIVERAVGNAVVSKALAQARISISQGQGMARPLSDTKVFPPMLTEMVAVGEETGALEKMLHQVAEFYDQEVERAVEGLTALIEPMIVILLGGVVGFIVIAIVLPMLDISSIMAG